MINKDLGMVTAYAYAVAGGYTGTQAEFEALLGNIASDLAEIENISAEAETLPAGSDATASYSGGVLSFGIPEGDKGDKGDKGNKGDTGATGNGIASIAKTSTSGLVDTYTITFTDGTTTTFDVTNGEVSEAELAETLEAYAKIDGSYSDLTAGNAEQLVSNVRVNDQTPYLFRTSGGSVDIGDREYINGIVGGTVAWNQLCNDSSVTVPSGHKYYMLKEGTASIGASVGTATTGLTSGTDMVIDLTQMFGSTIADYIYSLEQANAGAGVAWFKKLFPQPYYEYNAGELKSVSGLVSHDMTGFNQWDEEWEVGAYNGQTGEKVTNTSNLRCKNSIPVLPSTTYYFKSPNAMYVFEYDSEGAFLGYTTVLNNTYTTKANTHFLRFYLVAGYGTTYNHDICINIAWDNSRNGEYEPYDKHSYPLDSDLTLRGIPKLSAGNNLYYDGDVYEPDGTVTRKYGVRTYQSGDESLADAITDGTNTVYKLATPTTETADAYQTPQIVNDFGTEEYVLSDSAFPVPAGHNTDYPVNLVAKLEMAPNSPEGNGDYIVRQTNGTNEYVPLVIEDALPTIPSTAGSYKLTVTVAEGSDPVLSWEAE